VNSNLRNVQCHLDSEPRLGMGRRALETKYKDKHVFIIEYLKMFDNRLEHLAQKLDSKIKKMGLDKTQYKKLRPLADELLKYALPDMDNSTAARFTSTKFNPSTVATQLYGQIGAAKKGGARHISVAMSKTIFEWSHHFLKIWEREENPRYEMPSWSIFLNTLKQQGADSIVVLHPHAPLEGLEHSEDLRLNYVMIHPQTHSVSSNGWLFNLEQLCKGRDISGSEFNPLEQVINETKSKLNVPKKLEKYFIYISSPDRGAYETAKFVAQRHNLNCLSSLKDRSNEAISSITSSDNLETYLNELVGNYKIKEGDLYVLIVDDKTNTGGTGNDEAGLRIKQVKDFNKKNKTNFKVHVELHCTHLRGSQISKLKNDKTSKVRLYNSVPYIPGPHEQLKKHGFADKYDIHPFAPEQLCLGIFADYELQKLFLNSKMSKIAMERPSYRRMFDQLLVTNTNLGNEYYKHIFDISPGLLLDGI